MLHFASLAVIAHGQDLSKRKVKSEPPYPAVCATHPTLPPDTESTSPAERRFQLQGVRCVNQDCHHLLFFSSGSLQVLRVNVQGSIKHRIDHRSCDRDEPTRVRVGGLTIRTISTSARLLLALHHHKVHCLHQRPYLPVPAHPLLLPSRLRGICSDLYPRQDSSTPPRFVCAAKRIWAN